MLRVLAVDSAGAADLSGSKDPAGFKRFEGLEIIHYATSSYEQYFLAKGTPVNVVAPYVYVAAADDAEVIALIEKIADGVIDAIAFTGAAQVRRLHDAAAESGRGTELATRLKRALVAAVGPVVAKEPAGFGILNPLVPARAFAM
jgi:uroporphyrinogen-III synthase